MRLRETNGDQWGFMRPMGTHKNLRDQWALMGLRDYWRLLETHETNDDSLGSDRLMETETHETQGDYWRLMEINGNS